MRPAPPASARGCARRRRSKARQRRGERASAPASSARAAGWHQRSNTCTASCRPSTCAPRLPLPTSPAWGLTLPTPASGLRRRGERRWLSGVSRAAPAATSQGGVRSAEAPLTASRPKPARAQPVHQHQLAALVCPDLAAVAGRRREIVPVRRVGAGDRRKSSAHQRAPPVGQQAQRQPRRVWWAVVGDGQQRSKVPALEARCRVFSGGLDPPHSSFTPPPVPRACALRAEVLAHPAQNLRAPDEERQVARPAAAVELGIGRDTARARRATYARKQASGRPGCAGAFIARAAARASTGREAGLEPAHELPGCLDVPIARWRAAQNEAVALDRRIQAVAVVFGVEGARQLDGAPAPGASRPMRVKALRMKPVVEARCERRRRSPRKLTRRPCRPAPRGGHRPPWRRRCR